ncbi:hypothetical protein EVAR_101952_1 [Eumeta japonica]|uniref:Uncharacterized protein n=1 Tax=Eumeta variegata TaxID=151549 RepID=A0A4C1TSG9_EUMVA|nr:hypothetical protein EVAR_101952_1 [Eumeta japonica]
MPTHDMAAFRLKQPFLIIDNATSCMLPRRIIMKRNRAYVAGPAGVSIYTKQWLIHPYVTQTTNIRPFLINARSAREGQKNPNAGTITTLQSPVVESVLVALYMVA